MNIVTYPIQPRSPLLLLDAVIKKRIKLFYYLVLPLAER